MCSTALKEEFVQVIDLMPEDKVRRLLSVAYDMLPAAHAVEAGERAGKPRRMDPSAFGALKGGLVYMADDFDETPECFKEYM